MFKGILPSKRASPDFTMVTPLGDSAVNGKENHPDPTQIPLPTTKPVKPTANKTKTFTMRKPPQTKGKDSEQALDGAGMEQAFDRLLVSVWSVLIEQIG